MKQDFRDQLTGDIEACKDSATFITENQSILTEKECLLAITPQLTKLLSSWDQYYTRTKRDRTRMNRICLIFEAYSNQRSIYMSAGKDGYLFELYDHSSDEYQIRLPIHQSMDQMAAALEFIFYWMTNKGVVVRIVI